MQVNFVKYTALSKFASQLLLVKSSVLKIW